MAKHFKELIYAVESFIYNCTAIADTHAEQRATCLVRTVSVRYFLALNLLWTTYSKIWVSSDNSRGRRTSSGVSIYMYHQRENNSFIVRVCNGGKIVFFSSSNSYWFFFTGYGINLISWVVEKGKWTFRDMRNRNSLCRMKGDRIFHLNAKKQQSGSPYCQTNFYSWNVGTFVCVERLKRLFCSRWKPLILYKEL